MCKPTPCVNLHLFYILILTGMPTKSAVKLDQIRRLETDIKDNVELRRYDILPQYK